MSSNDYHFISDWHVPGTPEECFAIIRDAASLPAWWPAAFVGAHPARFSDGGEATLLDTKGWMPYILHWNVKAGDESPPHSLVTLVEGDFVGQGLWTLEPEGTGSHITFDWRIRVNKFGVKQLSGLLKPLFGSNHKWAMRKGEESLRLEVLRRRATSDAQLGVIPPPPQPTKLPKLPIIAGAALLGIILGRRRRKKVKTSEDPAAEPVTTT